MPGNKGGGASERTLIRKEVILLLRRARLICKGTGGSKRFDLEEDGKAGYVMDEEGKKNLKKVFDEMNDISHVAVYVGGRINYHGLTDTIPTKYYLTTGKDSSKIKDKRVKQSFENSDYLKLGEEDIVVDGASVKMYSKIWIYRLYRSMRIYCQRPIWS